MDLTATEARTLKTAIYVFGTKDRMLKTVEELNELSAALVRFVNQPVGHTPEQMTDAVLEEMADAEIMLKMCRLMFAGKTDSRGRSVDRIVQEKLARLARLAEWDLKEK